MTAITAATEGLASSRWMRLAAGLGALATAGLLATEDDGLVLCPFRRCTGGYCPGCGMTRSTGAVFRGDLVASWRHHPYLLLVALQAVVAVAVWSVVAPWTRDRLRRLASPLLLTNTGLIFAIWVARLALGHIPAPF